MASLSSPWLLVLGAGFLAAVSCGQNTKRYPGLPNSFGGKSSVSIVSSSGTGGSGGSTSATMTTTGTGGMTGSGGGAPMSLCELAYDLTDPECSACVAPTLANGGKCSVLGSMCMTDMAGCGAVLTCVSGSNGNQNTINACFKGNTAQAVDDYFGVLACFETHCGNHCVQTPHVDCPPGIPPGGTGGAGGMGGAGGADGGP